MNKLEEIKEEIKLLEKKEKTVKIRTKRAKNNLKSISINKSLFEKN